MYKLIISLMLLLTSLLAIDKSAVIQELNCKTYSFNGEMAGIYKYFNPTKKDWFLYMPKLNYLLVHETGKSKVSEGAQTVAVTDFESLTANSNVAFGSYIGSNDRVAGLSNNTFNIDDDMAGIYKYFDPTNKLWFLYMPKLNYLLVHETGKTSTADGAITIDVAEAFQEITVLKDPFGNTIGSIKFIAKNGCTSNSSSSMSSESSSSTSSEASSSSSSTSSEASSSSSSESSSSSSSVSSSSSSTGLETPPSVPDLNTSTGSSSSTGIETPPKVPTI